MKQDLHAITTYQAGAIQASAHRALQKLCDQLLEPFNITKMQWLIIGHVLDGGRQGVRISDLAARLATTVPYITTAVNLLESRGYLRREENGEDSRSKLLFIESAFKPKCAEIESTLRAGLRETLYAHIKPSDLHTYVKVLYQLEEAARAAKKRRK